MTIREYNDDICRDYNVLNKNVYFKPGQGCGTIWFNSVPNAREFINEYGHLSGQDSKLCKKCQCHYSINDKEYDKYPEFACKQWKEQISI